MQEIVCLYAKGEEVRYLSHLDLIRAWQRAVRRARLPVAHTQGALARPRIGFGPALGVGATSEAEHVVIELEEPLDPSNQRQGDKVTRSKSRRVTLSPCHLVSTLPVLFAHHPHWPRMSTNAVMPHFNLGFGSAMATLTV